METDEAYQRKERDALVAIVVLACLALTSLFVAFSYYCYIRNKVELLSRLRSPYLLALLGYCSDNSHKLLALPQLADRDKVVDIMDPTLEGQYSTKEVVQVAAIAAMCVQAEADYRPLMADVVQSLVPLVRSRRSAAKLSGCSSSFSLARSLGSPVGSQ
ncbi:hypothetical protein DY000_02056590 [Brassica cretica]|uniref:Serine-threonine/tyrosine-protein kinase catalytic domain-containing protein n=1 Tax=Brassica cretica TaxID=69181 RepID=A0ABQ7AKI5_BRACR|nr:hypothetical protein DY000_02056590 [Brassica cretica]